MNLPFFIAKRYLFSKKKQNIINIISWISMAGIVVGTMAIIIIVSVLNGFTDLIGMFYSDFDPDIKIVSVEGKMFNPESIDIEQIKSMPDVVSYAEVVEEVALLRYGKRQYAATIKGVPENYPDYTNIDKLLIEGEYYLNKDGIDYAVVGRGIANNLGVGISFLDPLHVYVPKKGKQVSLNPSRVFNHDYLFPSAVFAVLEDVDSKYMLVSKEFATQLFDSGNTISAIELDIADGANIDVIQDKLEEIVGDTFHVKNKEQQHDLVFKTMKSEKWAVYFILVFILLLASGNMIGNLTMLYIDKKEDISILDSMGLPIKQINRIFVFEGWLISLVGGIIGTILGVFVCWLQITFELIKLPGAGGSFVISAYPVHIIFTDIVLAFTAVLIIGFIASWYPVKFMSNKHLSSSNIA
ncbi:FtsX-like permease family protein [Draconibacterium sp. IB214405]|uniref:ABC transporter permease n=1 Tax=Draconibacterium sp. IB214405 TaxID=3097352 RepID=UPI002A1483B6|nr:FtsX-like permease family protein [Draconibacterium sp. IB214405]MDX8337803.1 FtsX-like permease family protein [Draconibacterium sp. IB214405]